MTDISKAGEAAVTEGFHDGVAQSQSIFRGILRALSRPGLTVSLDAGLEAPAGLSTAMAGAALTLCDYETPVWLDATLAEAAEVRQFLAFHTGAPIVSEPSEAAFALVRAAADMPPLSHFAQGTQEYPDRSTTLIIELSGLAGGPQLRLEGPGIDGQASASPLGLPPDFVGQFAENRDRFPCGIDLLLAAGSDIIGLPRSTRLIEG